MAVTFTIEEATGPLEVGDAIKCLFHEHYEQFDHIARVTKTFAVTEQYVEVQFHDRTYTEVMNVDHIKRYSA